MDTVPLQMYARVTTVTLRIFIMMPFVDLYVSKGVSMVTALNLTNASAMLVISDIIRIPIDVYQIVIRDVRMVYALLQIHALAMKVSVLMRTRDVCHSVQEVVSMGTALH